MSINAAEIPQIDGNLDAVDEAGQSIKTAGTGFSDTGSDVDRTWQGLTGVYRAPEAGELFAATGPVATDSASIGSDLGSVGGALVAYAAEVRPIQLELQQLKTEADAFNSSIDGDDDWEKDEDKVNEKNDILKRVNAAVAAWQAAERTCANAINATFGGTQYHADDGQGDPSADEYGYSAELLDGATAGDEGVPWGKASEVDKPWYEDAWNGLVSFGKGLVVDGLWGTVKGLGTLVGFDGVEAMGQAWAGVGKLALSLNPAAMVLDQTVGIPGMEKGELGATQLAAGKALIAYDMWGEDPARAAGATTGNILGAVIGTKGAGAAVKTGSTGAKVAEVGSAAARTFPKTAEVAAKFGTKVSDLKLNVTTSINTKVAAFTERLRLPTFGPRPAFAGAGDVGRTFSVADTAGTRAGATVSRMDDAAPGSGVRATADDIGTSRPASAATDATPGRGGPAAPLADDVGRGERASETGAADEALPDDARATATDPTTGRPVHPVPGDQSPTPGTEAASRSTAGKSWDTPEGRQAWVDQALNDADPQNTRPVMNGIDSPDAAYQRLHAGDTEVRLRDGGSKIWADGVKVDPDKVVAIETKYVRNPGTNALHEGKAPPFIQEKWAGGETGFDNEIARYGDVVRGSQTPVSRLRLVTSTDAAAEYLGNRARSILGPEIDFEVVVKLQEGPS